MANLNLNTVELISTLRKAPLNGAPSSDDYNESMRETLADLASLANQLNTIIQPILNALPAEALLPITAPVGVEGRTIWSDTSDQSQIFYDSASGIPLTLADSIRLLGGMLTTFGNQLTDQAVQVASLQSRLASTDQNDVALTLQSLSDSLNQLAVNLAAQQGSIASVITTGVTLQNEIDTLQQLTVGEFRSVLTPAIPPGSIQAVSILWTMAFPDNNYIVSCSVQDDSGFLEVVNWSYLGTGTGIDLRIRNRDSGGSRMGTAHASAHPST